ncbi:MAG: hypothetical protein ACK5IN_04830 [Microbacterium sp.]|uniref:hypothetical protein n=1 Tax=Microbacterium sp. TaxID=51671 RepID=UPI003A8ABBBC
MCTRPRGLRMLGGTRQECARSHTGDEFEQLGIDYPDREDDDLIQRPVGDADRHGGDRDALAVGVAQRWG